MKLSLLSGEGNLSRVQCEGPIAMTQVQEGTGPLERILGVEPFRRRVLFDLVKTNFIDSSGVSWMLLCHKAFTKGGGRIVFHSAPPLVLQTLQLLRMNLILHLAADEAAARTVAEQEAAP
jgi:anti-anti-sigma regulatory factor